MVHGSDNACIVSPKNKTNEFNTIIERPEAEEVTFVEVPESQVEQS